MKRLTWNVLSGVGAAVLFTGGAGFASGAGAPAPALGRLRASGFALPRHQLARSGVRTEFLHNLAVPAQEEIRQRFQRHSFAFEALE